MNTADLERRIDVWLAKAKWPRTACGHWIFTWNAFKIECDPKSALGIIEAFDLRPGVLFDGFVYRDQHASSATKLRKVLNGTSTTFLGEMPLDADQVRTEKAQSDVVIGEITRKPVTFQDAIAIRSREQVSGTISVTFEVTASGFVKKRTSITKVHTVAADGKVENRTATNVVEREQIFGAAPSPNPLP